MGDFTDFLTTGLNFPFLLAGCLVVGILILEIVAMMIGHSTMIGDHNIDFHADLNGNGIPDYLEVGTFDLMGWVNPAGVPFMAFLVIFAGSFAILGYSGQWLFAESTGHLAPLLLSIPLVSALTLPICRASTIGMAKIMPRDETSAVSVESLFGLPGILNVGPVSPDSSGVARITDKYGTDHNIIVFAEDKVIALGANVVLLGSHPSKTYACIAREISVSL